MCWYVCVLQINGDFTDDACVSACRNSFSKQVECMSTWVGVCVSMCWYVLVCVYLFNGDFSDDMCFLCLLGRNRSIR